MVSNKARKTTINFGDIKLDVYQLPDGTYTLSTSQVGQSINKHDKSFRQFIEGKSPEALRCKNLDFGEIMTEGAGRPIKAVPIKVAILYWTYWVVNYKLTRESMK